MPEVNILIVEDKLKTARVLEECYENIFALEKGYKSNITIKDNAFECITLIEAGTQYDLISLDVNLSGSKLNMGVLGTDVMRVAKEKEACKGIVVVSGIVTDDEVENLQPLDDGGLTGRDFRQDIQGHMNKNFPDKNCLILKGIDVDATQNNVMASSQEIINVSGINERPRYEWTIANGTVDRYEVYFYNNITSTQEHLIFSMDKGAKYIRKIFNYANTTFTGKELAGNITAENLPSGMVGDPVKAIIDGEKKIITDFGEMDQNKELATTRKTLLEVKIAELNNLDQAKGTLDYANQYFQSYLTFKKVKDKVIYSRVIIPIKIKIKELKLGELIKSLNYDEEKGRNDSNETDGLILPIVKKLLEMYEANPNFINKNIKSYAEDFIVKASDELLNEEKSSSKKEKRKITGDNEDDEYTRSSTANTIKSVLIKLYKNHYKTCPGFVNHLLDSLGFKVEMQEDKIKVIKNDATALAGERWLYPLEGNPQWEFGD